MYSELKGYIGALFLFGKPQTMEQFKRMTKTALWIPEVQRVGDHICCDLYTVGDTHEVVRVLWSGVTDGIPHTEDETLLEFFENTPCTPKDAGWVVQPHMRDWDEYKTSIGDHRSDGLDHDLVAFFRGGSLPHVIIFTNEQPIKDSGLLF